MLSEVEIEMFQTDQPSFSQTNPHNQHTLSTAKTTEFQPVYTAPAHTRTSEALPSRKKQNKTLPSTNPEATENEFLKRKLENKVLVTGGRKEVDPMSIPRDIFEIKSVKVVISFI